jgi:hypothetical protein
VHGVPPLVAEPSAGDDDRGRDDREEHRRADRRGDHPGVDAAAEYRRELAPDGDPVHQRIAQTVRTTCATTRSMQAWPFQRCQTASRM